MSDLPPNSIRIEPTERKEAPPKRDRKDVEINLIIASLEKSYTLGGTMLAMVSPSDGHIVAGNAKDLAESWRDLLKTNNRVRSQMMKLLESSGWSTVIVAHLMVAAPIVMNHKDKFEHLTNKRPKNAVPRNRVEETPAPSTF